MLTINTNEFTGYNYNAVYEFLMLQNETDFEIVIPKLSMAIKGENFDTYWEYHLVAYVGHKLNEIADSFGYYVPSVYKKRPYIFEVEIKDMEKFTDLLLNIIILFNAESNEEETEVAIDLEIAASEFFIKAFDDEFYPATWGLLSIANEYLE